jgi:hypothetical protein
VRIASTAGLGIGSATGAGYAIAIGLTTNIAAHTNRLISRLRRGVDFFGMLSGTYPVVPSNH